MLEGVNVALGITGSIAAVKTVELAHELRRHGAAVRGVMTGSAQGIIHPGRSSLPPKTRSSRRSRAASNTSISAAMRAGPTYS